MRQSIGGAALAVAAALGIGGCVGSEATFSPGDAASTDSGSLTGKVDGGSVDSGKPPGDGAASLDATADSRTNPDSSANADAADAGPPPPPPVRGKAGLDVTAGGSVSKSTSFKLVGAVGESPGGNGIAKSSSYTLKGGVIAGTQ